MHRCRPPSGAYRVSAPASRQRISSDASAAAASQGGAFGIHAQGCQDVSSSSRARRRCPSRHLGAALSRRADARAAASPGIKPVAFAQMSESDDLLDGPIVGEAQGQGGKVAAPVPASAAAGVPRSWLLVSVGPFRAQPGPWPGRADRPSNATAESSHFVTVTCHRHALRRMGCIEGLQQWLAHAIRSAPAQPRPDAGAPCLRPDEYRAARHHEMQARVSVASRFFLVDNGSTAYRP